jgi:sarcosine oxidase
MSDVEFVVIGAGMAGSATARALARAGRSVAVFEQFCVGHRRGSSHGAARIFRYSYPEAHYVRMAMEALPRWRDLEAEAEERLLLPAGGLDTGKVLDSHVEALRACGARFEVLSGSETRARWPALELGDNELALYQPDTAVARADATVRALVRSALDHGALVREEAPVLALRQDDDGVEVDTPEESLQAKVAVVTAGAWARSLLAAVGIALPVVATRQTVVYYWIDEQESLPTLVDWGDPIFYALPSPGQGLKAGLHHCGPVIDPSDVGEVDEETIAIVSERVAARFPGAEPKPHLTETCIYTSTADEHFIMERHNRIVVGSACSGHGFKFAPLTGERLAALALAR